MVAFTVIGSLVVNDAEMYHSSCADYDYYHQLEYYCTPAYRSVKILEIFGFSMMALTR